MTAGRYIALEGAEGCGKSTQAARLADELDALLTRETGGTPIGSRIRAILHDTSVTDLADRAEALLTAADRAQHLEQLVQPALSAGRHVVSDRSVFSTLAYQGYGRELAVDELRRINGWAIRDRWPDLVVLLDAPGHVLDARLVGRDLDRFEREHGEDFHRRVRGGVPKRWPTPTPSDWAVRRRNRLAERRGRGGGACRRCARRLGHMSNALARTSVWDDVIGQRRGRRRASKPAPAPTPVHAYLLVGPHRFHQERRRRVRSPRSLIERRRPTRRRATARPRAGAANTPTCARSCARVRVPPSRSDQARRDRAERPRSPRPRATAR